MSQNVPELRHGLWKQRRGKCDKCVLFCVPAPARKGAISINQILVMSDGENLFTVYVHLRDWLVSEGQPKAVNPLELTDKIRSIDPEGGLLGGVAGDFHDREVFDIDPYFPFEQVLLFAFRSGLENEAMVWAEVLFTGQRERVVRGRDRTVMTLPTRRCLALALHQAVEHHVTNDPRSLFGSLIELFLVRRPVVHFYDGLCRQFPLGVSDLVRPD